MLSFVITAREESAQVLSRTVVELLATSTRVNREIVVIDDGSRIPVAGLPGSVRVVRHERPFGVSRARRAGCSATGGEVLVVLDAHMTFEPGWLERMLDQLDSMSLLCAAYWDYERRIGACYGADLEWSAERDYLAKRFPGLHGVPRTRDPGTGAHEVPMLLGACYMMLRSTYEQLGGFSPVFRVWGADEQDLSIRAQMAGGAVKCVADARVGHLSRRSFPYPVSYDEVEFNQLAMIHSLFEWRTVRSLEQAFFPVSAPVRTWLESSDLGRWRPTVQRARRLTDRELFARIGPGLLPLLDEPGPVARSTSE